MHQLDLITNYKCEHESVFTGLESINAWLIPNDVSHWAKRCCDAVPGSCWKIFVNCL